MARRPATGFAWALVIALAAASPAGAQQLVISEFRLVGPPSAGSPDGSTNEFVEIFNPSPAPVLVSASSGSGYAIASSDGVVRAVIPNGRFILPFGHVLAVNIGGYSLEQYPAGNQPFTPPDVFMSGDTPTLAGIALFTTDIPADFSPTTRLDAVGPIQEPNPLYKEGSGYNPIVAPIEQSYYRDNCGKFGDPFRFGPCPRPGVAFDTNDNLMDFIGVSDLAMRFGAPGPESGVSPVVVSAVGWERLDPCAADTSPPNMVRDTTPVPAGAEGTVELRYRLTNQSSFPLPDLRLRIVDNSGADAPPEIADVRAITAPSTLVMVDGPPCNMGFGNVAVEGTDLDEPPVQAQGGGLNSSLAVPGVGSGASLDPGQSIALRVVLAVNRRGPFQFRVVAESHAPPFGGLPNPHGTEWCTDGCPVVTGFARSGTNPTASATVAYLVTFDRDVQNVSESDFRVFAPAFPDAFVQSVTGMGTTRTVTVDTGGTAAEGFLNLSLDDRDTITSAGNGVLGGRGEGNGSSGGENYDIDRARPSVTVNQAPAQGDPAVSGPVAFRVVFSENVDAFATGDVQLGGTAGATTATVSGGPSEYDVVVSGMTVNGTVTASVSADVCADALGNTNTASTSSDNVVTFNGFGDELFDDGFESP